MYAAALDCVFLCAFVKLVVDGGKKDAKARLGMCF